MELVLYLDAFWFVNFGMNLLLLWMIRMLLHIPSSYPKCAAAAAVGAAAACVVLLLPFNPVLRFFFLYLLISAGMVCIAFPVKRFADLMILVGKFYLTAFLVGGMLSFLYYRMNMGYFFWELEQKKIFGSVSGMFLLKAGVGLLLLFPFIRRVVAAMKKQILLLHPVEVEFEGKTISGIGFLDTGNSLYNILSGEPVLIGEMEWLEPLFTPMQAGYLKGYLEQGSIQEEEGSEPPILITLVPYHCVGESNGLLPAFRSDTVIVGKGREAKKKKRAMIAVHQGSLCTNREYHIILHNELT